MASKKAPAAPPRGEAPGFEEALERLEAIVEELEGGALSLEESIARYEEGMRLSRGLAQTLDEAEKRVERLTEGAEGPVTEPLDLGAEGPVEPPATSARPAAQKRPPLDDEDGRLF
jgi:exodeoxyribonuclease VII small subunit